MLHVHVRIHRWVIWWFYLGIAGGMVALVNILGRNLTGSEEHLLLVLGLLHWFLGGLVCWALEGIQLRPAHPRPYAPLQIRLDRDPGWHGISEFLLPGSHKDILPPNYRHRRP